MKKVKEVKIDEPEQEIRCAFCYCSLKNSIAYNFNEIYFYHYECLIEKFRINEVNEFELLKMAGITKITDVPPETIKKA